MSFCGRALTLQFCIQQFRWIIENTHPFHYWTCGMLLYLNFYLDIQSHLRLQAHFLACFAILFWLGNPPKNHLPPPLTRSQLLEYGIFWGKFKHLFEKRLLQVLDDCDADATAFMDPLFFFSEVLEVFHHNCNVRQWCLFFWGGVYKYIYSHYNGVWCNLGRVWKFDNGWPQTLQFDQSNDDEMRNESRWWFSFSSEFSLLGLWHCPPERKIWHVITWHSASCNNLD